MPDRDLARRLRRHVEGPVRFDALTRGLYATDASIYQIVPLGVVIPRTLDDVNATIAIAREEGVPVLPRGAGTSQCGQTVGRAVVIDASRHLDRILEVDREALTATVEPGVVLDHLNRHLAGTGLFFPVDVATASRATIGGMAGNNSGGARSIRYGIMADNVVALEAALADGRVAAFGREGGHTGDSANGGSATGPGGCGGGAATTTPQSTAAGLTAALHRIARREADELATRIPRVLRHVAGYPLHRLLNPDASPAEALIGSEGTLAFFRTLTLKLSPRPSRRVLGICAFPSLIDALDAVQHVVELDPHAVELVDHTMISLARQHAAFRTTVQAFIPESAHTVLLVEFAGDDGAALAKRLGRLEDLVRATGAGRRVARAEDESTQAAVWRVRKAALNIAMSMEGERKPVSIVEDCAIPLPRLAGFGAFVEDCFRRHGTRSTWYAHASVGLLHVRPALNMKAARDVEVFRAIAEEVLAEAVRLGGSWSGEHGDGILRSEFIERYAGKRLARAFAEVKRTFDPEGIMNPGKIVNAPRSDDRTLFRHPPGYRAVPGVRNESLRAPVGLPMAGEDAPGFVRTVEACNNNGACRKMHGGVMCPSFRVTREEADTTRGRANALRLAMSGQLGVEGLGGDEVDAVLDLCVGCKACQRECPARVDVAWLKSRVLHLRHSVRGVPLRERIFASLPRAAPVAARLRWLANLPGHSRWLARLGERALGVAADRKLPEWSARPFRDRELPAPAPPPGRAVVLLADTFHRYFEPEVPRAAARVLGRLGFTPTAPTPGRRPLCCGRPLISAGLLDEARAELGRTLAALAPLARRGLPIVGLEPSCLLTLRDEALRLHPGDDARTVAAHAQLFDEFLAERFPAATSPVGESGADGTSPRTPPDDRAADGRPRTRRKVPSGTASRPAPALPPRPAARIHGHCHQKAAGTGSATADALAIAAIPSTPIESSCCGMAGSFGYRARHLAVSRAMGELALMPAVRAAAAHEVIVANGFSCRAQIADGTGRRARHVAEVLDHHLAHAPRRPRATSASHDHATSHDHTTHESLPKPGQPNP